MDPDLVDGDDITVTPLPGYIPWTYSDADTLQGIRDQVDSITNSLPPPDTPYDPSNPMDVQAEFRRKINLLGLVARIAVRLILVAVCSLKDAVNAAQVQRRSS